MAKAPILKTPIPGPKSKAIVRRDTKALATTTKSSPVTIQRARNALIEDVDGNTLIDFTAGTSVLNVGHSHPDVLAAVRAQAEKFFHYSGTDFYYDVQVTLSEQLAKLTPGTFPKKVFLTSSGTEANEAAIKAARWSTRRPRFLAFLGGFHGRTMGALALTASKPVQQARFFPTMPGVTHVPYAYCYRCPYGLEYPQCDIHCAKVIEEEWFKRNLPADEVAAVFVEPVQGEGGYVVPPMEFLKEVGAMARRHDILLVDDEIQSGMGRTGKWWAIEHANVVPDIVTTAKSLGSGVPIGAAVLEARHDFGAAGAHSNTYGGNALACAAALATMDVIRRERLLDRAARLGAHVAKRLDEMAQRHETMGDNRGLGLMQATEFVKDRKSKEPAPKVRDAMVREAMRRGLVLLPCGESTVRYIPPLTIEEDLLDGGLDIVDESIEAASR